jgi:flagellar hook-associated protein 3 FlgL
MEEEFNAFTWAGGFTAIFTVQGLNVGELNPIIYFDTVDFNSPATDYNGIEIPGQFNRFTQENQEIQYEFGTNVRLTINTQARNLYSWQLFSDLQALVTGLNAVSVSNIEDLRTFYRSPENGGLNGEDLEIRVQERLMEERALYREVMRNKFSHMLGRMEGHAAQMTTEYTTLGSRLNRLELIYERLDENLDTLTELMSKNENIDILEVIMKLNATEAIMQAAMQVGARISQMSLVNFI